MDHQGTRAPSKSLHPRYRLGRFKTAARAFLNFRDGLSPRLADQGKCHSEVHTKLCIGAVKQSLN